MAVREFLIKELETAKEFEKIPLSNRTEFRIIPKPLNNEVSHFYEPSQH